MSYIETDVLGFDALMEQLSEENLSNVTDAFIDAIIENVPGAVVGAMEDTCPEETGELRDSIAVDAHVEAGQGVALRIGPNRAIHKLSKLSNDILGTIFEYGGKVGLGLKRVSHKKRTRKQHAEEDTIIGRHWMREAWNRVKQETLASITEAAQNNLIDGMSEKEK